MKRFLPVILAFALTTLALAFAVVMVRPGVRSIRTRRENRQHELAGEIDSITDLEEGAP